MHTTGIVAWKFDLLRVIFSAGVDIDDTRWSILSKKSLPLNPQHEIAPGDLDLLHFSRLWKLRIDRDKPSSGTEHAEESCRGGQAPGPDDGHRISNPDASSDEPQTDRSRPCVEFSVREGMRAVRNRDLVAATLKHPIEKVQSRSTRIERRFVSAECLNLFDHCGRDRRDRFNLDWGRLGFGARDQA